MQNNKDCLFERDRFVLRYIIEGKGRPVLVIGSSLYYPRVFSSFIKEQFQFIFMDHRGFAQSTSTSSFTLEDILGDIRALQKALALEKVILIGHSIHALMAIEYTKKYPELVSELILIAASPIAGVQLFRAADRYYGDSVWPERKQAQIRAFEVFEPQIASHPDQAFVLRMLMHGPSIWYDFNYDARPLWEGVTLNSQSVSMIWGSMFSEYEISHRIDHITCSVFLALGRYDYWNPPHLWEPVRDLFQDLTICVFEKSGHTPQLEQAALFDKTLCEWINYESETV